MTASLVEAVLQGKMREGSFPGPEGSQWELKIVKEERISPLLILNVGPEGEFSEPPHGNKCCESPFADDY